MSKKTMKDFAASLGNGLEKKKAELSIVSGGTTPVFDEQEKEELLNKVGEMAEIAVDSNSEDYERGKRILMSRGMSEEEVDNMPYTHVLVIGNEITGEEEITTKSGESTPVTTIVPKEEIKVDKAEDKSPVKVEEVVTEIQDTHAEEEETIANKKVKELIGTGIVKFVDKPMNSYRRGIENKRQKLLAREKRGKCCEMPLPNSNLRLNIYELKQSAILNAVTKEVMTSSDMAMKEKAIRDILDRSEVLCADGSTVSTDELLRAIAADDLPWIQYGASVANSVDKVPYTVRCERCGAISEIMLDVVERVNVAVQSIPQEIISEFSPSDDFKTCILKSKAGLTAVVEDKEARTKVYISNPSLYKSIIAGDMTRKIICDKFKHLLPPNLLHANIDDKYAHLVTYHTTADVVQLTSSLILASYIDKIEYYDLDAPEDNWGDEKYLDMAIGDDDTMDTMCEAVTALEATTLDNIDTIIDQLFIKHSSNLTTGKWQCYNCKDTHNEGGVSGLMLLTSILQNKIQNQG